MSGAKPEIFYMQGMCFVSETLALPRKEKTNSSSNWPTQLKKYFATRRDTKQPGLMQYTYLDHIAPDSSSNWAILKMCQTLLTILNLEASFFLTERIIISKCICMRQKRLREFFSRRNNYWDVMLYLSIFSQWALNISKGGKAPCVCGRHMCLRDMALKVFSQFVLESDIWVAITHYH